jgi:hypothetical protein
MERPFKPSIPAVVKFQSTEASVSKGVDGMFEFLTGTAKVLCA